MILANNLHKLVEKGEFSIAFIAEEGNIVTCDRAICTSWHSSGRTMNIKFLVSKQIRTIRRCTIIAFNDEELVL
ncbi:MAG TPA: hypothetical protein PKH58_01370 [Paludibacteraceae bacterium]|nr:hypothetical protein [Paludibacteraceae bacterium]